MTTERTRIYRWVDMPRGWINDTGRVLRADDERSLSEAACAEYIRPIDDGVWIWITRGGMRYEVAPTEDAARHACLMAVLHGDEGGIEQ